MLTLINKKIFPGFGISLSSILFFVCIILLLPLNTLIMQISKMTWSKYWYTITSPELLFAYKITFFLQVLQHYSI